MGPDEDGDYEINFMRQILVQKRLKTIFSSLKKLMQHPLSWAILL